jgi:hypothetical protein
MLNRPFDLLGLGKAYRSRWAECVEVIVAVRAYGVAHGKKPSNQSLSPRRREERGQPTQPVA